MGDPIPESDLGRRSSRLRSWLPNIVFGGALAVGTAIRLDQITIQIPGDDEWHSIHAALWQSYVWILTHFGNADHSIPLTVYEKLLSETVCLSEMGMRVPVLVAGIASLFLIPYLLRPVLGLKASVVLAWLLAISPLHVYFSRYARPYSPALLLTVLAVIALYRWRATRRARWGFLFLVGAVLGPWFHPIFLPFVLAPFAWLVARRVLASRSARGEAPGRGSPWPLTVLAAVGLLACLGPPIYRDFRSLSERSEGTEAGMPPLMKVFELLSGANRPLLAFGFGIALVLGIVAMRRRWSGLLGCLVFASACQAAAILLLGPAELRTPITAARYLLPALVVLLSLAALGLEHLDGLLRKEWRWFPPHAATLALGISLLAFGPLPDIHYRPNNFTNHTAFQYDYAPNFPHNFAVKNLGLKETSSFYLRLSKEPSNGQRIVEAPWYYEWHRQPLALYQRVHRWPVLVGFVTRAATPMPLGELPSRDPRFCFRNFVHVSDFPALREKDVRYVIFHKNPPRQPDDDRHPSLADVRAWIVEYRAEFGAPVHEDGDLCVFDVRARG